MKLRIAALGRIKSGPERTLVDDYLERGTATGRSVGLGPLVESELDNRSLKSASEESRALAASLDAGSRLILLDERGKALASRELARQIGQWRDEGCREAVFCIGGADGHDRTQLPKPDLMLAFGPAVFPHKLVRVMLAEQLYRSASILAGTPYHRD
ncbi:23S rRNA (pseudouridine(1915)-N(3))-methyltransferase RlmH [Maricaulis sp.]|uniref:23S rRNA (pseudouridine(1915)-N(3))-methyltransferase RlmH n=1 Tax=Maricaulis sp. TaxID=1486257 RepID=UPI002B27C1F1|nr:23S rRNA (pseudouridine(1915)-N(3))-methyltransferase RlmH [Maricaulis sp.]